MGTFDLLPRHMHSLQSLKVKNMHPTNESFLRLFFGGTCPKLEKLSLEIDFQEKENLLSGLKIIDGSRLKKLTFRLIEPTLAVKDQLRQLIPRFDKLESL